MVGRIFSLIAWLALGACSSLANIRYVPTTAEVSFAEAGNAPWARSFAQIEGLVERDSGNEARVRLLVENRSDATLQVVPDQFALLDGRLERFGEPVANVAEGEGWSVAPKESVLVNLAFPFPPRGVDLDSLTFTWALRRGVETLTASAVFDRARGRVYRDPFDDPFHRGYYGGMGLYDPWWGPRYGVWGGYYRGWS
ncbi:MAG: hypothetical protein WD226_07420 [Planctomycetota bacterium]